MPAPHGHLPPKKSRMALPCPSKKFCKFPRTVIRSSASRGCWMMDRRTVRGTPVRGVSIELVVEDGTDEP
jgi:hypothetical protein